MRILVRAQLGMLDPHLRQRLDRPGAGLLVAEARAGEPDRLDDLVADGEHRVQRGHGLLEDHRDVPAAHTHQLLLGQPQQVARRGIGLRVEAEQHLAVAALDEVRRQQADHRQGGDGLAAARFAHQAEGLLRLDVEARPVHRSHRLPIGPEPSLEVPHLEQRFRAPGRSGRDHGLALPGVRRPRTPGRDGRGTGRISRECGVSARPSESRLREAEGSRSRSAPARRAGFWSRFTCAASPAEPRSRRAWNERVLGSRAPLLLRVATADAVAWRFRCTESRAPPANAVDGRGATVPCHAKGKDRWRRAAPRRSGCRRTR